MRSGHTLLLAIDDREASQGAIAHLAGVVRAGAQFHINALRVLPHPIPTHLLEHGRGCTPEEVREWAREPGRESARRRRDVERAASSRTDEDRTTREQTGVARERIAVDIAAHLSVETIGKKTVSSAAGAECDTVVARRAARSGFGGVLHRSPSGVSLTRKGFDVTIWVVT